MHTVLSGESYRAAVACCVCCCNCSTALDVTILVHETSPCADCRFQLSAATNVQTQEGVAIKKVTNVFSKKILAKRALREIKLLQHFRGRSPLLV